MIQPMVDLDKNKKARGQRISDAIKKSGKTQGEIAAIIGVTPQSISKWTLNGSIQAENLWTFAEVTHSDIRYLMFGEPNPSAELHGLIDQLSDSQAKQVTLFINTLMSCDDANLEFKWAFSQKSSE